MTGRRVWPLLAFAFLVGCTTYREDLNRGQRLYEENQYEKALALWRVLEVDADSLSPNDQGRYAYLRGMTDYRLGFRADARHWLALARAMEQKYPGGLNPEWKERLAKSLDELNQEVYGGGANAEMADPAKPAGEASVSDAGTATPPP
jgi:hypothetical protein